MRFASDGVVMDVDFAEINYDVGTDEGEEPAQDKTCAKCTRAFKSHKVMHDRGCARWFKGFKFDLFADEDSALGVLVFCL